MFLFLLCICIYTHIQYIYILVNTKASFLRKSCKKDSEFIISPSYVLETYLTVLFYKIPVIHQILLKQLRRVQFVWTLTLASATI